MVRGDQCTPVVGFKCHRPAESKDGVGVFLVAEHGSLLPGLRPGQLLGFKRHLRAEISQGVGVFLFSEHGVTSVRGDNVESMAARLVEATPVEELLRVRPAGLSRQDASCLLDRLLAAGIIGVRHMPEPVGGRVDESALAFWDLCGADSRALTGARVGLLAVGGAVDLAAAGTALLHSDLDVVPATTPGPVPGTELSVVLCDDYLDPALAEVDRSHRAAGVPWLLAKPTGAQVWIGPVFGSPETGCWRCLAHRLWGNRNAEACVQQLLGHDGPAGTVKVALPALTTAAANLVAVEAAKWLAGHRHDGQRCVWALDSVQLTGVRHELRRRPQCPACGDPSLMVAKAAEPIVLQPTAVAESTGGGYRARRTEEVFDTYRHLISPVTGVVKEVTRDRRAPAFCHAYLSGPNPAVRAGGMNSLARLVRHHSGGKGTTARDAEVGALCEALERYSGSFSGDERRVRGSLRDLGEQAVDPRECLLYDERQYRDRAAWNAQHTAFQWVPQPFDEQAELDWTPVWSLSEQRHRLLPAGMLYYGFRGPGAELTPADSNGNAAGSSMADAVLQGMVELVERDAVALWWYNRMRMPGIDLDAFADGWLTSLRAHYAELGRELWALDLTSDLGVPVVVALSRRGGSREEITFGFGAHLDPRIALRRALTEQNHLLPAMLALDPDEFNDPDAARWFREASVSNQPYLLPDPAVAARRPGDFGFRPVQDISVEVDGLTRILAERGMQTLVLDQTRPDIGLPVVKVLVPGLRHFWARFGPGRLFDVPVSSGKQAAPTRYEDLNPIPIFM